MKFPIKIETDDRLLANSITEIDNSLCRGAVIEAPGSAKLVYKGTYVDKGLEIPDIIEFIVETIITINVSLFSAWLYDKLKGKPVKKIIIRHKEVTEITEDNIRKAVEEEINISD